MIKYFKRNIHYVILFLLIVGFIISKIPYLTLPFYWDEAWVYGPAIRIMEANKLSILPDALPVYYSRGHPLFFHFMGALWLRIFGTSLLASHTFALSVSVGLIISVFAFCKRFFTKEVGLIASLFLVLQPIFLAQSVLVLPEVMVSLLSLLTLYFFLQKKWLFYVLSGTLVLYTKETGIVAIGTSGILFLIDTVFINRKEFAFKRFFVESIILVLPLIFISMFFIIQKQIHGWYFFPEHLNYITNDSRGFFDKMESYSAALFIYWGRNVLSGALLVALFLYFYKKKNKKNKANNPILALSIFCIMFIVAGSFNFFSDRYSMSMIAPFVIVISFFIYETFTKRIFLYLFVISVMVVQIFIKIPVRTSSDHNLGYADAVEVHREMVNYCLENKYQNKKIFTHFLMYGNLTDPYCGYLDEKSKFKNVSFDFGNEVQLCIFYNMEGREDYNRIKELINIKLLKRFEKNKAWSEIYEVIKE